MATLIVMPRLSPTMEEGVLAKWLKKEGDKINPGDLIAEVETDKANMDFPLEDEGVLLKLLVQAGDTVKLGGPVAVLGEKGEDISQLLAEAGGNKSGASEPKTKADEPKTKADEPKSKADEPKTKANESSSKANESSSKANESSSKADESSSKANESSSKANESSSKANESSSKAQDAAGSSGRLLASPLAKRLAGDAGLELRGVAGSGPGGRIVKRDVEQALSQPPRPGAQATGASTLEPHVVPAPTAKKAEGLAEGDELVQLAMIRRTAAKRLVEAKQTVPHFYLTSEAPMDAALRFREQLNAAGAAGGDKVSVNDLVLKALARALRLVPAANMSMAPDGVHAVRHSHVDISVAVALEDGLITPVVRRADQKSVGAISREVKELAGRARDKRLRPEEYTGGTFSLTNLGMFGIREFFAIINPPESGILAVGKTEKRAVVVEKDGRDEVRIEQRMTLTLSCDHRIIDGALGAKLLAEVVRGLSEPMLLVL
ncbi:MAG: pyruvate dehydrogenase complex dihydrolipoamide acetyltransferase [Polyangia bacterium]